MGLTRGGKKRSRSRRTRLGKTVRSVTRLGNATLNIVPPVGKLTRGVFRAVAIKRGGKRRSVKCCGKRMKTRRVRSRKGRR